MVSAKESVIYSINIGIRRRRIYENIQASKHQESRSKIKKGQYVPYTSKRTASPYQEE